MCSGNEAKKLRSRKKRSRKHPARENTEKMTLPRRYPVSAQILRKIKKTVAPVEGETYLTNRNPRNLEFLRLAHKPAGYRLDKPGRCFWNK